MKDEKKQKIKSVKRQPSTQAQGSRTATRRWFAGIIFLFSFFIYFNSVFNDYNLDDELVTQNHRLTSKGISAIPEIFRSPYYEDQAGYKYEYRPIVLVTFAIEHSIFGDNPHISHFINVVLYGLLCVLLFYVLLLLFPRYNLRYALIATLLFAAHPIHTEVVASIKNRDEILALGFSLLALYLSLRYVADGKWVHLLPVPLLYVIGILSKSTAIPFAFLIPLTVVCLTDSKAQKLFWITLLLAVPTIFYARLYSAMQQVMLLLGLFGATYALYLLKNSPAVLHTLSSWWHSIRSNTPQAVVEQQSATTSTADFSFLKSKQFWLLALPASLALCVVSVLGIFSNEFWMAAVPFILLLIGYAVSKPEKKLVFSVPILLLALLLIYRLDGQPKLIEAILLGFLLTLSPIHPKYGKWLGWIGVALLVALHLFLLKPKAFTLILVILYALFQLKQARRIVRYLFWVFCVLSVVLLVRAAWVHESPASGISISFIAGFFWLFYQNHPKWVGRYAWAAIAFLLPLIFYFEMPTSTENTLNLQKTYYQASATPAADLTPVQAVRPLKFIEYPIEKTDGLSIKLGTALVILGNYFRLICVPYPLAFYYGYAYITPTPLFSFTPLAVLSLYLLLLLTALLLLRKIPEVAFSILFFLAAITVFSNLFIPIPGLMGDRFLFIPSIGFSVLLTFLLGKIGKVNWNNATQSLKDFAPIFKWSLGGILVIFSLLTMARNSDWKDRITLFRKDIHVVGNSAQAQNLLGLHLFIASNNERDAQKQIQMREEAVTHFQRALAIYPDFLNASFDMARTCESMGKLQEAFDAYANTVKIDTSFYAPYFSMAVILDNQGKVRESIPYYEKYLRKYPYRNEVYANLSFAYFKLKEYDQSIAVNRRLLARQPNLYEPTINIAKTYLQIGKRDSAYFYFKKTDEIRPGDANVQALLQQLKEP